MMITAFQKYTSANLACLPVGKDKMPSIPKGESWIGGWKNKSEYEKSYGIAIITGRISGNLECIDFDNHFGDAKEVISEWMRIESVRGIVNKHKLPMQSTVSGGFHLLYRCDLIEGNQKLAARLKFDEKSGMSRATVLIETRGEGGYFVVSPTPAYEVIYGDISKINYITAEERGILLSACRTFNKNVRVVDKEEEKKDTVGERYNNSEESVSEMISALKDKGWQEIKEGIWRRPGKNKGISATLGLAHPKIFYNFSANGDPFINDKGYSAFQVVALLKYNGDFKAFAKDLHERYGDTETKPESFKKKTLPKTDEQINDILKKSYIDLNIPVAKPPVILQIKTKVGMEYKHTRVFTLGNFSAITGKSKSKKTFLTSLFLATITKEGYLENIFYSELPKSKDGVVLFDTEQSAYDAYITARRVWDIAGSKYENFTAFDLREYSPLERCDIIDKLLEKAGSGISYVVIDGVADLATAINDELEATRVVGLLMKWTKIYNIHITVVIHQNKNDNYATGHLGSAILKKSECIISVTKDEDDNTRSEVNCDLIRGTMDFDKFAFKINEKGLPEIEFANSIQPEDPFEKT